MRILAVLTVGLLWTGLGGCGPGEDSNARAHSKFDAWLARSFRDMAIRNAIVREHTVFPYQFAHDSGELNELGRRDLRILASHFKVHAGELNVRRGEASRELYQRRIETVIEMLTAAGVGRDNVEIRDGLPGGDGMTSERVTIILRQDTDLAPPPSSYRANSTVGKGM